MGLYTKVAGAWQEIGVDGGSGMTWAKVSGGTVTEVTNPDGSVDSVHTFTANGTLTVEEPGYARVLLVGGGTRSAAGSYQGSGGGLITGLHALTAGPLAVTVGTQGAADDANARLASVSSLGSELRTRPSDRVPTGYPYTSASAAAPGLASDISGTVKYYGGVKAGATTADEIGFGQMHDPPGNGTNGIVIVRVQKSAPTVSGVAATGGTVTEYTGDGTNGVLGQKYRMHKFTADGPLVVTQGGEADVLVVGGGGAGGGNNDGGRGSGGGGAGGVIVQRMTLAASTHPITVGAGGTATGGMEWIPGAHSAFGTLVAMGGGGGGSQAEGAGGTRVGQAGASGGGGGDSYNAAANNAGGAAIYGTQGNAGGQSTANENKGGGGGGAGGPGQSSTAGGKGGAGLTVFGSVYGKGGDGGNAAGASYVAGAANTGNGGAGGTTNGSQEGLSGGSGVVIVRYEIA